MSRASGLEGEDGEGSLDPFCGGGIHQQWQATGRSKRMQQHSGRGGQLVYPKPSPYPGVYHRQNAHPDVVMAGQRKHLHASAPPPGAFSTFTSTPHPMLGGGGFLDGGQDVDGMFSSETGGLRGGSLDGDAFTATLADDPDGCKATAFVTHHLRPAGGSLDGNVASYCGTYYGGAQWLQPTGSSGGASSGSLGGSFVPGCSIHGFRGTSPDFWDPNPFTLQQPPPPASSAPVLTPGMEPWVPNLFVPQQPSASSAAMPPPGMEPWDPNLFVPQQRQASTAPPPVMEHWNPTPFAPQQQPESSATVRTPGMEIWDLDPVGLRQTLDPESASDPLIMDDFWARSPQKGPQAPAAPLLGAADPLSFPVRQVRGGAGVVLVGFRHERGQGQGWCW